MLFVCSMHGRQSLVGVSSRFATALEGGGTIPADWVRLVIVQSPDRVTAHQVDVELLRSLGVDPGEVPLVLTDRDPSARQLNDRLLIQKLFPSKSPHCQCKACLAEAIEPRDASHLRMPPGLAEVGAGGEKSGGEGGAGTAGA